MQRDAWPRTCSVGACSAISRQSRTRSSTGRSSSSSRATLRKPLGSPMTAATFARRLRGARLEHAPPLVRHHLHEPPLRPSPRARASRARFACARTCSSMSARTISSSSGVSGSEVDHRAGCSATRACARRRARRRSPPLIPAAKLRPVGPRTTTVPPVMYSHPWSPTPSTTATRAAVAHGEPLAGAAREERLAARRAVEARVAHDDVLVRLEARAGRRAHGEHAAGQPLADVVVRVALEHEQHAARGERAEALPGRTGGLDDDRVRRGAPRAPCLRAISPASRRAERAVGVRQLDLHRARLAVLDAEARPLEQALVGGRGRQEIRAGLDASESGDSSVRDRRR